MLKLKLQYFGHLMQRADSSAKTLILGKTEVKRKGLTENEMVGWHHQHNGLEDKLWERVNDRESWPAAVHEIANVWT